MSPTKHVCFHDLACWLELGSLDLNLMAWARSEFVILALHNPSYIFERILYINKDLCSHLIKTGMP